MISKKQLVEWERLANKATEGPWRVCADTLCRHKPADILDCPYPCEDGIIASQNDLEFIAAAREAVPALIAEVRKLQKEADWLAGQYNGPMLMMSYGHVCPGGDTELLCDGYTFKAFCDDCQKCWRKAAKQAIENDK